MECNIEVSAKEITPKSEVLSLPEKNSELNGAFEEGGMDTSNTTTVCENENDKFKVPLDLENNKPAEKRKRHRRGSKKNKPRKPRQKYKPYNKLTYDEKRKLDEIDAVKAVRKREELALHKGRAIAPYNTTQFLMEEHDPGENNLVNISHNTNVDNSEGNEGSSSSSDEYYEKDFNEFYENVHIDTLNSYSKDDLIKNVYELERKIENLERNTKNINIVIEENIKLTKENKELREQVLKIT